MDLAPRDEMDPADGVGQDAYFHFTAVRDDNLVQIGQPFVWKVEEVFQVYHRNDPASYADDAENECGGTRDGGQLSQRIHFAYIVQHNSVPLIGERKL